MARTVQQLTPTPDDVKNYGRKSGRKGGRKGGRKSRRGRRK